MFSKLPMIWKQKFSKAVRALTQPSQGASTNASTNAAETKTLRVARCHTAAEACMEWFESTASSSSSTRPAVVMRTDLAGALAR